MEALKQSTYAAQKDAEEAWVHYRMVEDCCKKALEEYHVKLKVYRVLDKQLAEVDGRLIKLPPSGPKERKTQKQPELTLDQLKEIAKKLGVSVIEETDPSSGDLTDLVEQFENGDGEEVEESEEV